MSGYKDRYGDIINEGDTINFCFGIPITSVNAKVIIKNKCYIALTPEHNPKQCSLPWLLKNFEVEKVEEK